MRFACVLIEHLPTRIEAPIDCDRTTQAIVVLRAWDERVLDATPIAIAAGIVSGDSRRRVEQLCPQGTIVIARESIYQERHDAIRAALLNFTNAVETQVLGEFFIEISGLVKAFRSEKELADQLSIQVGNEAHLKPKIGLASNKSTAQQAAWQTDEAVSIMANGGERKFLVVSL